MNARPGHIALNAVFLRPQMGGIETHVRRLVPELRRLAPEVRLSVFVGPEGRDLLAREDWASEVSLQTHPLLGRPGTKAVSELTVLGALAATRRVDVLYSIAMTGPLWTRAAHVVNIPDIIWMEHPDPAEMATVRLWKAVVPPVARRAQRLITQSSAVRDQVTRLLRVPADRIDVVPLGAGSSLGESLPEAEVRARFGLGDGAIVLSVSAQKAHKNLVRLVRALRDVAGAHPDVRLVLPGNRTGHGDELDALAASLGVGANVIRPGWIDAAELEGLYAAATCVVVPSLDEGFGLPVLEAMRRGAPVASSQAGALPEAGGDAARWFDPADEAAMASALRELLDSPQLRADLAARGRERAAAFTWARNAEDTLESLERAWREKRR